jgi:hypothetical protein
MGLDDLSRPGWVWRVGLWKSENGCVGRSGLEPQAADGVIDRQSRKSLTRSPAWSSSWSEDSGARSASRLAVTTVSRPKVV